MIIVLTIITQIGGIVWFIVFYAYKRRGKREYWFKKFLAFATSYILITLLVVPILSSLGGRVPLPLKKSGSLAPHSYWTVLLNRNYVTPELREELLKVSNIYEKETGLKLIYLDANFPFIDGFPLLPHLSHNDGRKVDISFAYNFEGKPTNRKPSRTGYGVFVDPINTEKNQTEICKSQGYWQYDYTKYFTLGRNRGIEFNANKTKELFISLLELSSLQKIFVEPHLKERLSLEDRRIRFQGCYSVRHDDHIHIQIKKE